MLFNKEKITNIKDCVRFCDVFNSDWKNGKVGTLTDHGTTNDGVNTLADLGRPLSKGMFYQMWNTRMPHVKV
jgi:hypothetical protein